MTEDQVRVAAVAIANARAGRRGVTVTEDILEMLPEKLRDEVIEDARVALGAARGQLVQCPMCANMVVVPG